MAFAITSSNLRVRLILVATEAKSKRQDFALRVLESIYNA